MTGKIKHLSNLQAVYLEDNTKDIGMNNETKTMVRDFKTKYKMEVLMKKTTILAVVMIVAQGAFAAAPGAKPAHLNGAAAKAMGIKSGISADRALEIARVELGAKNENLRADKMTDGFIKLIQMGGEALRSTSATDKEFANSVKMIVENVGKEATSTNADRETARKAGTRMVFEVLPDLIQEGSAEAKALVISIGKGIDGGKSLSEATYLAVKETYPHLKDSKDIMEKVREILNCNKA